MAAEYTIYTGDPKNPIIRTRGAVRVDVIDGETYRAALADRDQAEALLLSAEAQNRQLQARVRDLERRNDELRGHLLAAHDQIDQLEERLNVERSHERLPF